MMQQLRDWMIGPEPTIYERYLLNALSPRTLANLH